MILSVKRLMCLMGVLFFLLPAGAYAQAQATTVRQDKFPFTDSTRALDQAAIDDAIAAAQARDLDTTPSSALLYHGLMLFQEEKYEQCIPFLEEALKLDPSLQAGWEGLGWAYVRTGEEQKTWELWTYFQQLMPDESMPYNLLAQAAIMKQDWVAADKNFRQALKIKPKLFDLRFWHAQNLLRLGIPDEAEKIFRQLIKEEPDRLDIQINLANLLTHHLEYDEAVTIWRMVNDELPGNVGFMMDQALLELRVGELKRADQLCLDVLALETSNIRALMLRADIADIADMSESSVERLQRVIDSTQEPKLRGRLRLRMAGRCDVINERKPGRYTEGFILEQIRIAIDENPADVASMVLYAEKCLKAKRYAECRKWAAQVLEKHNRHNIRAKNVLFELAIAERRFDDAEQILHDRFSNYDPTDPMRYYFEARLHMARGTYNDALRCIDQMEAAAEQGCVLTLLYHDLTESDWMPVTSVRRFYEHLNALRQEGFTFISPADIPSVVGLPPGTRRADPEPVESVPWTAQVIDHVRYGITGERKFKSGKKATKEPASPMKVVAVTFDDALRAAFMLGTPVAEEIGVPFGMFAITKPSPDYAPSVAGWGEMNEYAANGTWVVGSHLYGAHYDQTVDAEGKNIQMSLPNRLWLPEKNRLESMNEWDKRMRHEFRQSKKILTEHLGENDSPVGLVAYPYGDVGQESSCNLSLLRNPSQSIIAEASRNYQVGFVQSMSGYTAAGDNLLLSRRFEPNWFDEGADVVRHAYEYHPLFMARRTRVEIAFLMNKPHMADEMLAILKRDGYPEELCRRITVEVRAHFRSRPDREMRPLVASSSVAVDTASGGRQVSLPSVESSAPFDPFASEPVRGERSDLADYERVGQYQEGRADPWIYLSNPYVGGDISHSKANDQFEVLRYGAKAGLNLNRNLQLSADYYHNRIEQRTSPRWNRIPENDRIRWISDDPGKYPVLTYKGGGSLKADNITPYTYDEMIADPNYRIDSRQIPTDKYLFKAIKREARARLSYRTQDGVGLSAALGLAQMDLRSGTAGIFDDYTWSSSGSSSLFDSDAEVVGDIAATWAPRDDLSLYVFYARDLVTSAIKEIRSDSVGAVARWKPSDTWHLSTRGMYWSYEDDNALFYAQMESFWEMRRDLGVWFGIDASTTSASDASDYYWAPYWDQRIMGVLRYLQSWQGYSFRLDLMAGLHREDARPLRMVSDDGLSSGSDWETAWGITSSYNKRFWTNLDLFVDASVMALQEYIDHRFLIGFNLGF